MDFRIECKTIYGVGQTIHGSQMDGVKRMPYSREISSGDF